jgi:hypothetical protein
MLQCSTLENNSGLCLVTVRHSIISELDVEKIMYSEFRRSFTNRIASGLTFNSISELDIFSVD